ncbi:MAG TPA: class I SAM-dependent methyltransferase [Gemmatimonadaceae bacterium]
MSSYDVSPEFGTLYDSAPVYAERADVGFYVEEANRAGEGSVVLELGSGTGRLTLPLARAGHSVIGLDLSPAMLARARARLAAEKEEVRRRVTLIEGDIRDADFTPPTVPDLVIAPFHVIQHFASIDEQLHVLALARRVVRPGGRLVFDAFNPAYAMMIGDRSAEVEDVAERPLGDGRFVRRTVRVPATHWAEQVIDVELIYYVRSGEHTERFVQAFPMRWFTPAELEHLVARAGFRLEAMYGGFDRRPLADGAPEIIVVAAAGSDTFGV